MKTIPSVNLPPQVHHIPPVPTKRAMVTARFTPMISITQADGRQRTAKASRLRCLKNTQKKGPSPLLSRLILLRLIVTSSPSSKTATTTHTMMMTRQRLWSRVSRCLKSPSSSSSSSSSFSSTIVSQFPVNYMSSQSLLSSYTLVLMCDFVPSGVKLFSLLAFLLCIALLSIDIFEKSN